MAYANTAAPATEAQVKFAHDLGIDPAGLDRATLARMIETKKKARAEVALVPSLKDRVTDLSNPNAFAWSQMVSWFELEMKRGKNHHKALDSALEFFDPFGRYRDCYPSQILAALDIAEGGSAAIA